MLPVPFFQQFFHFLALEYIGIPYKPFLHALAGPNQILFSFKRKRQALHDPPQAAPDLPGHDVHKRLQRQC